MKTLKWFLFAALILVNTTVLSGCWNYREIESVSIVSGLAIDKDETGKYLITVEIVKIKGQKDSKISSKTISMAGDTIFDAIRNAIELSGKRLYWSHAKTLIIGGNVARQGVLEIIDWVNRDSETRTTLNLLVSKEKTAREILNAKNKTNEIVAFGIDEMLRNEKNLSKTFKSDVWRFIDELESSGISAVTPTIVIKNDNGEMTIQVDGSAVFQKDKCIGYLTDEESKALLFIRDEIKGGLLINELKANNNNVKISLEIFKNKTKINPVKSGNTLEIDLETKTEVAIDELAGSVDIFNEQGIKKVKAAAEEKLKNEIIDVIKRVQDEYDSDIFGFGAKVKEEMPEEWKKVKDNWEEVFKDLNVNVKCEIKIRNTAMMSKEIDIGD